MCVLRLPKESVTVTLMKDREIVLAAVKQTWTAVEFAHETLKKDREIVLATERITMVIGMERTSTQTISAGTIVSSSARVDVRSMTTITNMRN